MDSLVSIAYQDTVLTQYNQGSERFCQFSTSISISKKIILGTAKNSRSALRRKWQKNAQCGVMLMRNVLKEVPSKSTSFSFSREEKITRSQYCVDCLVLVGAADSKTEASSARVQSENLCLFAAVSYNHRTHFCQTKCLNPFLSHWPRQFHSAKTCRESQSSFELRAFLAWEKSTATQVEKNSKSVRSRGLGLCLA